MAIENTAQFVQDLNSQWPQHNDFISEGDDHIRLIKETLRQTFPTATEAMTIAVSKLNKMDELMDIDVNDSVNMKGHKVTGVANGRNDNDAANIATVRATVLDTFYPVGRVVMFENGFNPNDAFGGAWIQTGKGRVLVGAGLGVDDNGTGKTFTSGTTGGEYTHIISEQEAPPHVHGVNIRTNTDGVHDHPYHALAGGGSTENGVNATVSKAGGLRTTITGGGHRHDVIGNTENYGEGHPMPLVQPYLTVVFWKRTS